MGKKKDDTGLIILLAIAGMAMGGPGITEGIPTEITKEAAEMRPILRRGAEWEVQPAEITPIIEEVAFYPTEAPEIHREIRPMPTTPITEPIILPGGIAITPIDQAEYLIEIPKEAPNMLWY